ncbi:hypothetical protein EDD63_13017 [Breznakia blatticola]|uniref:Uncharacterized protein n=1 Tax=Breznakia blatticola TaxID=1754012 RepID=A0A4V3G6E0_9FIRM|nr:hypothetical protein [Breznakia blatticola]TDW14824.1 hypothetical protein EDD63_13017 [Breznakia blatticola]
MNNTLDFFCNALSIATILLMVMNLLRAKTLLGLGSTLMIMIVSGASGIIYGYLADLTELNAITTVPAIFINLCLFVAYIIIYLQQKNKAQNIK